MNKDYNKYYNKDLREKARALRNNPTKAERRLWYEVLCRKQLLEYKFLRQRPVDYYIADFMCKELDLIIEVDGITHDYDDVQEKDLQRQKKLEALGFTVLRFSDWEVMNDLHGVITILENWIKDHNNKQ